jgi:hypothetical protein
VRHSSCSRLHYGTVYWFLVFSHTKHRNPHKIPSERNTTASTTGAASQPAQPLSPEDATALPTTLPALFTFALTWSLGASCNKDGRPVFDGHLRSAIAALSDHSTDFPTAASAAAAAGRVTWAVPPGDASVYEWLYEAGAGGRGWVRWMDSTTSDYKYDPGQKFSQIVVPTVDTVSRLLLRC